MPSENALATFKPWVHRASFPIVSGIFFHEPLHCIHHVRSSVPHFDLPRHTYWLTPADPGDTAPFPNYRSALKDLLRRLWDPRVGSQWKTSSVAEAG